MLKCCKLIGVSHIEVILVALSHKETQDVAREAWVNHAKLHNSNHNRPQNHLSCHCMHSDSEVSAAVFSGAYSQAPSISLCVNGRWGGKSCSLLGFIILFKKKEEEQNVREKVKSKIQSSLWDLHMFLLISK